MDTTDRRIKAGPAPRVLAINDLSGHSHTSLLAVIPILNTLGVGVTALPTAILSTNTEQSGFQLIDLEGRTSSFLQQWHDLGLQFDAIYSGFLSSAIQVEMVIRAIEMFRRESTLVVIDPVMADDGELYPCFDQTIISSMLRLVSYADLITPNLTEAALLLDKPYEPEAGLRQVKTWCRRLADLGPERVVITSVPCGSSGKMTSVVGYDRKNDSYHRVVCRFLPVTYPGTGDIFTSVLTGLLLQGNDLIFALEQSVNFVSRAMAITLKLGTPAAEGICLEHSLQYLLKL